jgi:tetratricopeptide (TPR) repeat protein
MNKVLVFLLPAILAASASGQDAVTTEPSPKALLSFSVVPNVASAVWPLDSKGNSPGLFGRSMFGPSFGATLACRYRPASSPLFIGTDFGYSVLPLSDNSTMSMLQPGLVVGLQRDIRSDMGVRCFGSIGYSYNLVQEGIAPNSQHLLALVLPLDNIVATSGAPFVGAGTELSWSFNRSLSMVAGIKFQYFLDLYANLGATLGVSWNLPVGGPRAAKPPVRRAAPLKSSPHPRLLTKPGRVMNEKLSQFLRPGEPAVLLLSEQINSRVEEDMGRAVDKNLQSAIGFHEALRLMGVAPVATSLEKEVSAQPVKSPLQTLQDGSGDSNDLSVLCCAFLESVQVETAFISVPAHEFMAFALAANADEAREMFSSPDEFILRDGKVWVPIDVTQRDESFLSAWQAGANEWRNARKQAHFYPVGVSRNAETVSSPLSGAQLPVPDRRQLAERFRQEVGRLVDREVHDREAELLAALSLDSGSPGTLNALGVLYARWDLLEKAEAQFQEALETSEYAPALVNLGNVRLLKKLPAQALGFYRRAAAVAPHDPAVLLGLARSNYELQNFEHVKEAYDALQTQSAQLAERFSYLRPKMGEAPGAAEADQMKDVMVWGEEK